MLFADRVDAGKKLAIALQKYRGIADIVLALPRGGVITASPVAKYLGTPLDLVLTRKIGHPRSPEYAIGAVGEGGVLVSRGECALVDQNWFEEELARQKEEIRRQRHLYLTNRISASLKGKVVIIVDDGMATGHTVEAALEYVKKHQASKIIVAVPVAAAETLVRLKEMSEDAIALHSPEAITAISSYYQSFPEIPDTEVIRVLDSHLIHV